MRVVARRVQHSNEEIDVHDVAMKQLVDDTAPQLAAEPGIGYVTAAVFVIAWSHPGRCRSEAAYARLGAVGPLAANSGTESGSSPLESIRGPPTQLGHLRRGSRQNVPPRTNEGLRRSTPSRRQNRARDPTLPQAPHRTKRLATPRAPEPKNHRLTDREGSSVIYLPNTVGDRIMS